MVSMGCQLVTVCLPETRVTVLSGRIKNLIKNKCLQDYVQIWTGEHLLFGHSDHTVNRKMVLFSKKFYRDRKITEDGPSKFQTI